MGKNKKSQAYQAGKNFFALGGVLLDCLLLLLFFSTGWTFSLKHLSYQLSSNFFIANGIYIIVFSFGMYLAHLPLSYFSSFFWEKKFNLSTQKKYQWLKDDIKKSLLSLFMVVFIVEVIYTFLKFFPNAWWIFVGTFLFFLMFVLARLVPQFIIPLFYEYSDIKNEELKLRIFQLFEDCDVSLRDVFSINLSTKTKKANAMLCGIGTGRRVVLSDTLIRDFSMDEIEAVVAHEIGHYRHRDILKLLFLNSLVIFLGIFLIDYFLKYSSVKYGLQSIEDISFFPVLLLAFMVFGVLTTPLLNSYSRFVERKADLFSLDRIKNKTSFISMMKKLGQMNLAEYRPGRLIEIFLYDHPPLYKRIQFAEKYIFNESFL